MAVPIRRRLRLAEDRFVGDGRSLLQAQDILGISLILNPGESVPTLRSLFLEGGNEGHEDAPTPDFIEGGRGTEVNDSNGKLYGFERHYLGNGTIIYRAMVEDAGREFRGELSGEFDHLSGGLVPARVEPLVRAAIRKSTGFRT
jgi:hypothetical protein